LFDKEDKTVESPIVAPKSLTFTFLWVF